MHKIGRLTLLASLAASLPFVAVASPTQKTPKPKLTLARAQAIALKARPGKVTDHELEAEKGGSGLRYSFDIKAGGKAYEVGVDAVTGKVLEDIVEGPNPD